MSSRCSCPGRYYVQWGQRGGVEVGKAVACLGGHPALPRARWWVEQGCHKHVWPDRVLSGNQGPPHSAQEETLLCVLRKPTPSSREKDTRTSSIMEWYHPRVPFSAFFSFLPPPLKLLCFFQKTQSKFIPVNLWIFPHARIFLSLPSVHW